MMVTSATTASAVVGGDSVRACSASATILGQKAPGTVVSSTPKKSRICVLAMSTAIPLVKPTTTGRGMNDTAAPIPVAPRMIRMTPAIIVHMNRPSMP